MDIFYKGETVTLEKSGDKLDGKNQDSINGKYIVTNKETRLTEKNVFIKKPNKKSELFTEWFAGQFFQACMDKGLIEDSNKSSFICADLIKFKDGSYGLMQPTIQFIELFKIIGTQQLFGEQRSPWIELFYGREKYKTIASSDIPYFGLTVPVMWQLLVGNNSIHSGNIGCKRISDDKGKIFRQFVLFDYGATGRFIGKPISDIFSPPEYQHSIKQITKNYPDKFKAISNFFPTVRQRATWLKYKMDEKNISFESLILPILKKTPSDLLNSKEIKELLTELSLEHLEISKGDYSVLSPAFITGFENRLNLLCTLEETAEHIDGPLYQSTRINLSENNSLDTTKEKKEEEKKEEIEYIIFSSDELQNIEKFINNIDLKQIKETNDLEKFQITIESLQKSILHFEKENNVELADLYVDSSNKAKTLEKKLIATLEAINTHAKDVNYQHSQLKTIKKNDPITQAEDFSSIPNIPSSTDTMPQILEPNPSTTLNLNETEAPLLKQEISDSIDFPITLEQIESNPFSEKNTVPPSQPEASSQSMASPQSVAPSQLVASPQNVASPQPVASSQPMSSSQPEASSQPVALYQPEASSPPEASSQHETSSQPVASSQPKLKRHGVLSNILKLAIFGLCVLLVKRTIFPSATDISAPLNLMPSNMNSNHSIYNMDLVTINNTNLAQYDEINPSLSNPIASSDIPQKEELRFLPYFSLISMLSGLLTYCLIKKKNLTNVPNNIKPTMATSKDDKPDTEQLKQAIIKETSQKISDCEQALSEELGESASNTQVHKNSNTEATKQCSSAAEFEKKSNAESSEEPAVTTFVNHLVENSHNLLAAPVENPAERLAHLVGQGQHELSNINLKPSKLDMVYRFFLNVINILATGLKKLLLTCRGSLTRLFNSKANTSKAVTDIDNVIKTTTEQIEQSQNPSKN